MATRKARIDDETIIAKYNEHKQKAHYLIKYLMLIGIIAGVCLLLCKHIFQDRPEFATLTIFVFYPIGIIVFLIALYITFQISKYFFWFHKRIQIKKRRH